MGIHAAANAPTPSSFLGGSCWPRSYRTGPDKIVRDKFAELSPEVDVERGAGMN
jgi:hypothetical protein